MNKFVALIVWVLLLTATAGTGVKATEITGAGSTFVYPILSKWSAAYTEADGRQRQLSIDRVGRRHRQNQSWDG